MQHFIDDFFLLQNELAKNLYKEYAAKLPIFDYHCHLKPEEIATNYHYENIVELWLDEDHYKWRAMRANGVSEIKITGNASNEEKFEAWAETVESLIGNPLYHWTHLEMKIFFGIEEQLGHENWLEIYQKMNKIILEKPITSQQLLEDSKVRFVGTTDSPVDSLENHQIIKAQTDFGVKVVPSFRPDLVFNSQNQKVFTKFLKELSELTQVSTSTFQGILAGLKKRMIFFEEQGCFISDHSFEKLAYERASMEELDIILAKSLRGEILSNSEKNKWQTELLYELGKEYNRRDWVMQIHFGATRNNNHRLFKLLGPDIGVDSIVDQTNLGTVLNQLLNRWDETDELPKTILYNLNPIYNDLVVSTASNFQGNCQGIKNKVQFGAAWWFNDTKRGILNQLECLANQGLVMNFVGMLTDSRSFLSYTRHDYFRRILCQWVSEKVMAGEFPQDVDVLKRMIEGICYNNAVKYFRQ